MANAKTENSEDKKTAVKRYTFEPREYCTLNMDSMESKIKMFNAHNASLALNSIGEEPFNIVGVTAEHGERARSNNPCQNTYIFTDDGRVLFTQSNGIGKTINEIVDMIHGDFTSAMNGYVTAQVSAVNISEGRTYKRLVLLSA